MDLLINVLIIAAIAAVAVTLGFGVASMYRGGEGSASRSNKLMRLRVALQAAAVVLLVFGFWWKSRGG